MAHRFRTFMTNNTTSNADIDRRNKQVRAFKAAKEQAENLSIATEANAIAREKAEQRRNRDMVPIITQKLTKEYYEIMPELILREYFTNLVSKSLIWDAEAISENMAGIRYMSHKYISQVGGLRAVKEAAIDNKSEYLMSVYNVCMEAGKKLAKKKSEKLKKEITPDNALGQKIDFTIDTDTDKDINKRIDDLDTDELSDLVKTKVLQVVKDENESQKKDDDFVQDLKASVDTLSGNIDGSTVKGTDLNGDSGNDDNADYGSQDSASASAPAASADASGNTAGEGTNESFSKFARGGHLDIQRSLFRSMMSRSYTAAARLKMVKENSGAQLTTLNNNEENDDPVEKNLRDQPNSLNIYDIYLNDGGEDLSYIDYVKNSDEIAIAGDDASIDNEEVLAEALGMYTILECASTIKLISPTRMEIKKVIAANYKK